MLSDDRQISQVIAAHSGLRYYPAQKCLAGSISADYNDSYSVIIVLRSDSGKFPRVIETGERIPQTMDRHKFPDTDICCLTTEARAQVLIKTKVRSLSVFVEKVVIPYFQNNSYYEINKKYLHGEYSHGWLGISEGYEEILKIENPWIIERILRSRLRTKERKGFSSSCFCGSGKSVRHCDGHFSAWRHFLMIDLSVVRKDLGVISKGLREWEEKNEEKNSG